MNLDELSDEKISEIIALAWCDKTTFEQIKLQTNINQDQVKRLMKKHLKPSSYTLWRKRVTKKGQKNEFKYKSKQ